MKTKSFIDIFMSFLLLFLMGFQFWSVILHEVAGALMFALFIAHHLLNYNFYKNIFRGKYNALRILFVGVNFALLIAMIFTMLSSICLSTYIFAFLHIPLNTFYAHTMHLCSTFWLFVLIAMHTGLHFAMIFNNLQKKVHFFKNSKTRRAIFCGAKIAIIVYGAFCFVKRRFIDFMFLHTHFAFMDSFESKIIFYCEYLAIALAFAFIADFACHLLKKSCHCRAVNTFLKF